MKKTHLIFLLLITGTIGMYSLDKNKMTIEKISSTNQEFYIVQFDKESEIFEKMAKSYNNGDRPLAKANIGFTPNIDSAFADSFAKQNYTNGDSCLNINQLRYLHLLYIDFDGSVQSGEMICNKLIAEDLLEIFEELFDNKYPIEKIRLVDEYDADDELSMEDNNTSCFNFRYISGTTKISKHGYGVAVDINPLYNPYIKYKNGEQIVEPVTAQAYTDRSRDFDYKITCDDLVYRLFTKHGFEWGGDWSSVKDYQHFELPDSYSILP